MAILRASRPFAVQCRISRASGTRLMPTTAAASSAHSNGQVRTGRVPW